MSLLNLATGDYPVSFQHVRDANPNVSFPAVPTDADLSPFGYANVRPTARPSTDPRTQRVEGPSAEPDGAGGYRELWTLREATPEEIAEWDAANPPPPDWNRFKNSLRQTPEGQLAAGTVLFTLKQNRPIDGEVFATAFLDATNGDDANFVAIWTDAKKDGLISAESLQTFLNLAIQTNLPERFVDLFR
jgi:hypothetical protein